MRGGWGMSARYWKLFLASVAVALWWVFVSTYVDPVLQTSIASSVLRYILSLGLFMLPSAPIIVWALPPRKKPPTSSS